MAKRSIGISISSGSIHAVQLSRTGDLCRVEKLFHSPMRRSSDSPEQILRLLASRHGFDRHSLVAVALPHHALCFRTLHCDAENDSATHAAVRSVRQEDLPLPLHDITADGLTFSSPGQTKTSCLLCAAPRPALDQCVNTLSNTKLRVRVVDAPIFALHAAATFNHPELTAGRIVLLYADDSHLIAALTENGHIALTRNLPCPSGTPRQDEIVLILHEIEISWHAAFAEQLPHQTTFALAGALARVSDLTVALQQTFSCNIITVDPFARATPPEKPSADADFCLAQGLALRALLPEGTGGVNLLRADTAQAKKAGTLRRDVTIFAILLSSLAVVSLGGLFVRLAQREADYRRLKTQIRTLFEQTIPEETNIVDELTQMQSQLQSLQKDYALFAALVPGSFGPLEVLSVLTANTPPDMNLNITGIFVADRTVQIAATCDSYQTVYAWKERLQKVPEFVAVAVQEPRLRGQSRQVQFNVTITLAAVQK